MVKNYNIELDVLTPVIINSGEVYQFGELLSTENKVEIKNNDKDLPLPEMRRFSLNDPANMFGNMSQTEIKKYIDEVTVAISKRDNVVLKKSLKTVVENTANVKKMPIRVMKKASSALMEKPCQQVFKVVSSPLDSYTYIPGSSIKGALRTGLLETLREERDIDYWKSLTDGSPSYMNNNLPRQKKPRDAQDFEMEVMKDKKREFKINEDPFKYLKVSDFIFSGIDAITYISKVGNDDKMPIYSAMTNSYAFSGKHVIARGVISVDSRFYKELELDEKKGFNLIADKAGEFYLDNMNSITSEINSPLMKYVYNSIYTPMIEGGDNIIRLGHYIGIKNYTFNVNQLDPPRKAPHDINIKGGRVVKLEEGVLPGMCIMRIV